MKPIKYITFPRSYFNNYFNFGCFEKKKRKEKAKVHDGNVYLSGMRTFSP